jgi:uncharacterized protein YeaO (DUF488 family)
MIKAKRVYEQKATDDGYRVLVDRLWPRGLSKEKASIDLWMKEVAPSNELRKWFAHDPAKWNGFKSKYKKELADKKDLLAKLNTLESQHKKLTLLYSAHDQEHNQAIALAEVLNG